VAGKNKQEKKSKKSGWSLIGDVVIIGSLLAGAVYYLYQGATGFAFDTSRLDSHSAAFHQAAVRAGKVPFVADQLLYFPLAVAFVAGLALFYLHRSERQTGIVFLSGAAIMFLVSGVTLTLEIVWVASGVPYTNYSGAYSSWQDPSRYTWPIIALSLWLIGSLAAGAIGVWGLRALNSGRSLRRSRR